MTPKDTRRDGAASGLLVSDCWWVPKSVLWGYRRTVSDASGFHSDFTNPEVWLSEQLNAIQSFIV